MKKILIILAFTVFNILNSLALTKEIREVPDLKSIFDNSKMNGSILIYDLNNNEYTAYDSERCRQGFIPASTFKIPNTLIGLELGILKDRNYIFKWDGEKRMKPDWEADLTVADAFRVSCVPCYQQLAVMIGVNRMKEYIKKFEYGKMDINKKNINTFWLEGKSKISQMEQIQFLVKLYQEKLPLKSETFKEMKEIMFLGKNNEYTVRGKTGWAVREGNNYGWFVGWIEKNDNAFFFATNIEPMNQEETDSFDTARKLITMNALKFLKIIK